MRERLWLPSDRATADRATAEPSLARIAALALAAEPLPGGLRVTALDGRSGAGKTSLASRLSPLLPGAVTVHLDDIYPGWDGLRAGVELLVSRVLEPAVRGGPPQVPTWDWTAGAPGPVRDLPRTGHLIVEGVGCGARAVRPFLTLLVWVQAPTDLRRSRALARDPAFARQWERWAGQEEDLLAHEQTARAARVVLDTGPSPCGPRPALPASILPSPNAAPPSSGVGHPSLEAEPPAAD